MVPANQGQPNQLNQLNQSNVSNEVEFVEQAEVVGQLAVREQDGPKITPTGSDANLTGSRRITRQSMTVITGSEYSLTQHIHV
jgi:hypothetical protein